MNLELYPWQEECLQSWSARRCRGIINVVTGAGKTILALAAAERLRASLPLPLRVKIVVPQTFLTSQWSSVMQKLAGIPRQEIGYYYGLHKDSPERPYMIYVVNSARYSLARNILNDIREGYAVLLIADECHHYASPENRKIFEFLPHLGELKKNFYSLGLSATPRTMDYEKYLLPALGPEIYRYTFRDAAENKNIRPYACFHISLRFTPDESEEYELLSDRITLITKRLNILCPSLKMLQGTRYFHALKKLARSGGSAKVNGSAKVSQLAQAVLALLYQRKTITYSASARINCALQLIEELDSHARILVFGERIEQADRLYEQLNRRYPGRIGRYHSQMEQEAKKAALDRYRSGETRILITCRALDEGFDLPSATVGIVLSSSSVERQRIQRLGRILRNSEDNCIAGLYYLYIRNSSEIPTYMEETQQPDAPSFSLSYEGKEAGFRHPVYENMIIHLLESLKEQGKNRQELKEYSRCFSLGMLRTGWLMDAAEITEKIKITQDRREKNYWVCMKLIAVEQLSAVKRTKKM